MRNFVSPPFANQANKLKKYKKFKPLECNHPDESTKHVLNFLNKYFNLCGSPHGEERKNGKKNQQNPLQGNP